MKMKEKTRWEKGAETKRKNKEKKKKLEEIKSNTRIESIQIYCGKLEKTVVIPWKECRIDSCDDPCELCGSHGWKRIEANCPCGMEHEIEVDSW
jgi:hypothetical protein